METVSKWTLRHVFAPVVGAGDVPPHTLALLELSVTLAHEALAELRAWPARGLWPVVYPAEHVTDLLDDLRQGLRAGKFSEG